MVRSSRTPCWLSAGSQSSEDNPVYEKTATIYLAGPHLAAIFIWSSKQRHAVERCINKLKQWRGLATRYDKTATAYQAALHLAAIHIWAARCSLRNGLGSA
ncbi:hypothetical protein ABZ743_30095 [Streptomyces sp. NPDC006662]|uniref:hypothetical protein n=1 Tax=Streptomyces sp. NPDC006662 TaxID=3156902 RepID=UPI0033E469F1